MSILSDAYVDPWLMTLWHCLLVAATPADSQPSFCRHEEFHGIAAGTGKCRCAGVDVESACCSGTANVGEHVQLFGTDVRDVLQREVGLEQAALVVRCDGCPDTTVNVRFPAEPGQTRPIQLVARGCSDQGSQR